MVVHCGGQPRFICRVLTGSVNETTNNRHAPVGCRWFHVGSWRAQSETGD